MSVQCVHVPILEAKMYSQTETSDFKGLSMVATVPDHQSTKTCWGWDNFQYPKLL